MGLFFLITISIAIFLCIRAKIIFGTLVNHYSFFTFATFVTVLFYYYHPLVKVQNTVYIVFSLGALFFDSTVLFLRKKNRVIFNSSQKNYLNPKAFGVVVLLLVLLLIPFLTTLRDQIVNQGLELWQIRQEIRTDSTRTVFQNMSLAYVLKPFSNILMIYSFYAYIKKTRFFNTGTILLLAFIFSLLLSLIDGGGRGFLIQWVVFYIICSLFYSKKTFKSAFSNSAKFRLPILIIPVAIVLIISFFRGIMVNEDFVNIVSESYTLYIPLFNYYWTYYDVFLVPHTLGVSTFESIYLMINMLGKTLIGYQGYMFDYVIVDDIIQESRFLGDGYTGMAHASFYFRFIRDWGMLGIAIGPILLSLFLNYLYKLGKSNEVIFMFYVFCLIDVVLPPTELHYAKTDFLLTILYLVIFRKFFFVTGGKKIVR